MLSPRQKEIAKLVTEGLRNCDIAAALGVSTDSLKNYLREIYDLTGHSNRTTLALWWIKQTES